MQQVDKFFLGTGGPSLKYFGSDVVDNQFAGWNPIAAEAASGGGYNVAWKLDGADQYTVWHTDSSGNYVSSLTGAVSGGSFALQNLETGFLQDLNTDGTTGPVSTTIEANGSTNLVQKADLFFLGDAGPTLKYLGAEFVDNQIAGWNPIGVEANNGGGFDVVWKHDGTDEFTVWHTDSSGSYASSVTGVVPGSNATLVSLETTFDQDLNGNGFIG